jgi:hypothetical protein
MASNVREQRTRRNWRRSGIASAYPQRKIPHVEGEADVQYIKLLLQSGLLGAIALAVFTIVAPAFAADALADDFSTFVTTYDCSVVELFMRIHANPNMKAIKSRFLILNSVERPSDYVQCAFDTKTHI